ncbi:MAG: phage tail tape measure protein [Rhodobacteraceae bacterium]|nr:phage tail tape measure protein [Paracoccaceae bacterium]
MNDLDAASAKLRTVSNDLSRGLTKAADDVIFKSRSAGDALRQLSLNISRSLLESALQPIGNAVGGAAQGLAGDLVGAASNLRFFARGGALLDGEARGPSLFPLQRGKTGVAGEAGPEAILPLARGPDGRLGVSAGQGGGARPLSVTIITPDAASFRRSRAQTAAQLARALDRGRRNL